MVEASTALAILENVSLPIKNIVGILYTLVGGVFGLYLILLFMRFKEYRTLRKILTDIRHDLRSLNMHLGNYHVKPEKESHFKKSYHKFKSSVKKKK